MEETYGLVAAEERWLAGGLCTKVAEPENALMKNDTTRLVPVFIPELLPLPQIFGINP